MFERRSWKEFQGTGLLWFMNRTLHLFGWAVVLVTEGEGEEEKVIDAYPARTSCRGFPDDVEDEGFNKVYQFLDHNIEDLQKEMVSETRSVGSR